MLLEVLIALLVFSVGVLGLVGLQANSMQQSTQSRYHTEAMLLANDLTGQMWVAASRAPAAPVRRIRQCRRRPFLPGLEGRVANTLPGQAPWRKTW